MSIKAGLTMRYKMDNVPVNEGYEYDVNIVSVGRKGDGVALINNFVILVKGALVNRSYRIRITKIENTFAFADVVRAL